MVTIHFSKHARFLKKLTQDVSFPVLYLECNIKLLLLECLMGMGMEILGEKKNEKNTDSKIEIQKENITLLEQTFKDLAHLRNNYTSNALRKTLGADS